ncbi:MAG: M20/M25/M40 family metallo-hydrolase [Chloroflexi bacterium]|nr:M20/M25/M40 family metallo-hydrolase [Chloroflexota bacterium]
MIKQILGDIKRQWEPLRHRLTTNLILDRTIKIQQIPAPTFDEIQRARYIENQFRALRLKAVKRDPIHNVVGWTLPPDQSDKPILLISAHTDTVFPRDTPLTVRQEQNRVYGPGIGDNSLGVGTLMLLAEIYAGLKRQWDIPVGFVANAREEGLGNLDGIRVVIERYPRERIAGVIVLEGMALGRIYHAGIAVRRLKITTYAEGGHSWLHFGQPNAIHTLVQLAADISRLVMPEEPRTTYNIGMLEGGHSINSIATEASLYLDMRSTTSDGLAALEKDVRYIVATKETDAEIKVVGDRPEGYLSIEHPLVVIAEQAYQSIGLQPSLERGSTDANYMLAKNIPSVVVGVTYGGNAHRLDEYIEIDPLRDGVWSIILMVESMMRNLGQQQD